MSRTPQTHRRIVYGRIAVSIACYLAFAVGASTAIFTDLLTDQFWWVAALLGGAVLIMPRRIEPTDPELAEQMEEESLDELARLRSWVTYTRIVYLVVAAVILFGFPYLVGA